MSSPVRYAVIATHHKTGSVWMRTVFHAIGKALEIPFIDLHKKRKAKDYGSLESAILFDDHSDFSDKPEVLQSPEYRVLHIIRDPRDIVISAMHYHRAAGERWLHEPRKEFRGQSYQEKLNSLADDRERYMFEMRKSAGRVIRAMRNWDYNKVNCLECKYESLIVDEKMEIVARILAHLGFGTDMEMCRRIFWENSLFGGLRDNRPTNMHIRSGERRQWQAVFDQSLANAFVARFGNVLIELGYEPDNSWVSGIAPSPANVTGSSAECV